jgi:putative ABC transport system permease protein
MSWLGAWARLRGLFAKGRLERELEEEVRAHLEMQAEDNQRAGMSPAEARYAAMRSFGGVEPMKEELRERRSFALLETIAQDLSYGARSLVRRPGFTVAACLSLALGIGMTTAIFTVLNAVALRPLPYVDADRLLWMTTILKGNSTDDVTLTVHFLEWRRQNHAFTALAGYNYQTRNLTGVDEPRELSTAKASESLLPLLGVQPILGRNFLKQEDYKGRDQVALLGNQLWRQQFGGDPNILGKAITLDGNPFTVVGILPEDFVFPGPDQVQLITPLGKDEAAELQFKVGSIVRNIVGRLKPGVTMEEARAEMEVITSRLPIPAFKPTITLKMMTLRSYLFGDVKTAGLVLVAAAGFLMLIACANVSNLLLARWMQRDREMSIRAALGGSRARLVCQLLTESALLGILACAAGALLAFWARRPLLALSPSHVSGLRNVPFDGRVLGFAIGLGILTTLLFGLLPAFRATNVRLAESIKVGGAAVVGGRGSLRVLSIIAASEIAIMLVLSTGTGLMLQSFWKMRYANLGFRPDHLVAATMNLTGPAFREKARRAAFIRELLERTQGLPGVELATLTTADDIPPGDYHATNSFAIEGRDQPLGGPRPIALYPMVSPDYFAIMGIPLLEGRLINDSDGENAPPVVVVNQTLVRRYFDRQNPIGHRIRSGGDDQPWRTIAGVVGDVKTSGLASAAEPTIYLPYCQTDIYFQIGLMIRSPLDAGIMAAEIRKLVAGLDRNQPVASVRAMDDRLNESVSGPRFTTVLLFVFAGLAVLLGLIGVYGVMGCRLRWQLRELAVRQALGAQRKDVIWHVLRQGFAMIVPGVLIGLVAAALLSKLLSSMLYEVSARDPLTFAAVSASLAGVALLACWIPAMRAARVDPLESLRHE